MIEEVVRHELDDQRDIDVHRAFQLRQGADVDRRLGEVHVLLETLGGDHVPHQVDDLLALGGHLHLGHRVEQQVAPVVVGGRTHVIRRPQREQLHGDQPRIGVGE